MSKYYKVDGEAILSSEIWPDATREELRVLTYVMAMGGEISSTKALAAACGITAARARSSVSLWEEAGVITPTDKPQQSETETQTARITYEFPERMTRGAVDNETSVEVADSIRDGELAELIEDIAELVGRPTLSTQEIKHITALWTQLGLDHEYIITLAAFIAGRGRLTAKKLLDDASRLVEDGVSDVELLEKHIEDIESHSGIEWEMRRLMGIYNRGLSKSEKKYIRIWTEEYGYGIDIIGEAYDIMATSINKISMPYMNKLLTIWHDNGLTTVEAVKAFRDKESLATKGGAKGNRPKGGKGRTEEPEYADFSSDDALMRALERSYGDKK